MAVSDADLSQRLQEVLDAGWFEIPDTYGYGGTGARGKVLEELLGLDNSNFDTPDAGRWEIKFHSKNALLTLFHKEAKPRRHLYTLIQHFGIVDCNARQSFRHTIKGESAKGFKVVNNNGLITIRHDSLCESQWPYWTHDTLINAFVGKLRRLIVVAGRTKTKPRRVCYDTAHLFWEPQTTVLLDAIETGIVAIDFDARTTEGQGLRNHGTKFRIKYDDLQYVYHQHSQFEKHSPA